MRNTMRKYGILTVVALLFCAPMAIGQTTLTLQSGVSSNPSQAGVYTGAYPFTLSVNGSPSNITGVCDSFENEIYVGESWKVNVNTFSNLSNTMFGNAPTLYDEAAWLVTQMYNPANAASISNISYAIWQIFDPSATSGSFAWLTSHGVANNVNTPYSAAWWLQLASTTSFTNGEFSNLVILTPINGSQSTGGEPQEFIVKAPESPAIVLMGADLLGLLGLAFIFRRRLVRPIS